MLSRLFKPSNVLNRIVVYRVSASLIKQLREMTGSPINDCKKALEKANEDLTLAQQYLKERGLVQAEKKINNQTREGVIAMLANDDSNFAVVAQINCETDFVARTPEFLTFSQRLIQHLINGQQEHQFPDQDSIKTYLTRPVATEIFDNLTIDEYQRLLISKLQENIVVAKLETIRAEPNSVLGIYRHNTFDHFPAGLSGCLLELRSNHPIKSGSGLMIEGAQNLATLLLGMNPKWLTRGEVPKQNLDEEITAISKTMKENANEKQKEMIIKGKLQKFYENNVFTDMEYLLDGDSELTIGNYMNLLEKELEIPKGSLQIGRTLTLSVK